MKKSTLVVFLCLAAARLSASDKPPQSIDARASGSKLVVVATVADVQSRFGANAFGDQVILSDLQLEVAETLKGQSASNATVTIEGGEVNGLTLKVSDMPVMRRGDRAVFFMEGDGGRLVLHGRGSGVLKLDDSDRVPDSNLTLQDVRRSVRAAGR